MHQFTDSEFMTAQDKELVIRQWETFLRNGLQRKHFLIKEEVCNQGKDTRVSSSARVKMNEAVASPLHNSPSIYELCR